MVIDRNTIADLYVQGTEFDLPNPKDPDEPVKLYMKKLGPVQQQEALKKANAAKLRIELIRDRADDDEDKMEALAEVQDIGDREDWIVYLAEIALSGDRVKLEQELSEEEEWAKDGYLQSLVDAWDDDMQAEFDKGEGRRSVESEQIWTEMNRFNDILEDKLKKRRQKEEHALDGEADSELHDRVLRSVLERNASMEWLRTFRNYQIMFGVHNLEGDQIFDDPDQIRNLPTEAYRTFIEAIESLNRPAVSVK